MNYFHDKFLLGIGGLLSSSVSLLGAIFVQDPVLRYFYATFSVSILTAFFLALVFRRSDETIRLVVGRCGMSILGGVFGTRILFHFYPVEKADTDIVFLMGVSGAVTIASFLIGFAALQTLNRKSNSIAESWLRSRVPGIKPESDDK